MSRTIRPAPVRKSIAVNGAAACAGGVRRRQRRGGDLLGQVRPDHAGVRVTAGGASEPAAGRLKRGRAGSFLRRH
jgi:hypothetical protein